MKKILLLGASGSIGTQCIDVIKAHPDSLKLVGASVGHNVDYLRDILKQFKLDTEIAEKKALVDSYSEKLDADIIAEYTNEKLAEMSKEDIEKELCFKLVKSNPSVFSKQESNPQYIPKNEGPKSGLEEILNKYKK